MALNGGDLKALYELLCEIYAKDLSALERLCVFEDLKPFNYLDPKVDDRIWRWLQDTESKGGTANLLRAFRKDRLLRKDVQDLCARLETTLGAAGEPVPPTVMVRVTRLAEKNSFSLRSWVFPGLSRGGWPLCGNEVKKKLRELPGYLDELRQEIGRWLEKNKVAHVAVEDVLLEFVLPLGDLGLDVDRWRVRHDGHQYDLGCLHRVVVRRRETATDAVLAQAVKARWLLVADGNGHVPKSPDVIYWLFDDNLPPNLGRELLTKVSIAGLLLGVSQALTGREHSRVLRTIGASYVPVALWPRRRVWPDAGAARQVLTDLLGASPALASLPTAVRRLRQMEPEDKAHPGRHLTLLFDDPSRECPADAPATDPSRS